MRGVGPGLQDPHLRSGEEEAHTGRAGPIGELSSHQGSHCQAQQCLVIALAPGSTPLPDLQGWSALGLEAAQPIPWATQVGGESRLRLSWGATALPPRG